MYRHRIRHQILYGKYREYMEIAKPLVDLARERGLPVPTLLAPMVGTGNEVIWETEYPDLATFQRDNDTFYADDEVMKRWRKLWEYVAQGSVQDELLQEAPHIA